MEVIFKITPHFPTEICIQKIVQTFFNNNNPYSFITYIRISKYMFLILNCKRNTHSGKVRYSQRFVYNRRSFLEKYFKSMILNKWKTNNETKLYISRYSYVRDPATERVALGAGQSESRAKWHFSLWMVGVMKIVDFSMSRVPFIFQVKYYSQLIGTRFITENLIIKSTMRFCI